MLIISGTPLTQFPRCGPSSLGRFVVVDCAVMRVASVKYHGRRSGRAWLWWDDEDDDCRCRLALRYAEHPSDDKWAAGVIPPAYCLKKLNCRETVMNIILLICIVSLLRSALLICILTVSSVVNHTVISLYSTSLWLEFDFFIDIVEYLSGFALINYRWRCLLSVAKRMSLQCRQSSS